MKELYLKNTSSKKVYTLFQFLDSKNLKEVNIKDIKNYVGMAFGISHQTQINYRNSFLNLGFFVPVRKEKIKGNLIQIFKIDYNAVINYFEKVGEYEQVATDS